MLLRLLHRKKVLSDEDCWYFETQGTIGTEDSLTPEQISQADIVLLAIDVKVSGRERFAGKKVVEVPTDVAIKSPKKLIAKLHELTGKSS